MRKHLIKHFRLLSDFCQICQHILKTLWKQEKKKVWKFFQLLHIGFNSTNLLSVQESINTIFPYDTWDGKEKGRKSLISHVDLMVGEKV